MIQVKNLAYKYCGQNGNSYVLSNLNLDLLPGHIYGLLGENGVGKTTLLTLLAGAKKPTKGSVKIDGCTPFDGNPKLLSNQYILTDEITPESITQEQLAKINGSMWPKFSKDKYYKVLDVLENRVPGKMTQMSFGQVKKSYVAFALATNAKYIYMDEPTNGLDIPSKSAFRKALLEYTDEDSIIVISSHQVKDLEGLIDPIIILDKDGILLNASEYEITKKLYFDYDFTKNPDAIWTESVGGSTIQVCHNTKGLESKVNIEALFNTFHSHKEMMVKLFSDVEC